MTSKEHQESRDPAQLLPLTPAVFHILLALSGGECHGYGIMQEVDKVTGGQLHLGPGTLYRSIQRMLIDGLIEETTEPESTGQDDERRRNYRLTAFGLAVVGAEAMRLKTLGGRSRAGADYSVNCGENAMPSKHSKTLEDFHTITPHLTVRGVSAAVKFYEKAFGAAELYRNLAPDGKSVMHAELLVGDSRLLLHDEFPDHGSLRPQGR